MITGKSNRNRIKDVFGSFLFSIVFFYLHGNDIMKNDVNTHTPVPIFFTLFGYFHTLTYQDLKLKQNTKTARFVSCVH